MDYRNIFSGDGFGQVLFDEPMKYHTTFKVGGPCDVMLVPTTEDEVLKGLKAIRDNNLDYYIIGNGSNLLVRDKGMRAVVVKLHDNYSGVSIDGGKVTIKAGTLLSTASKKIMAEGLAGIEFASGIPGDVGGAIAMNAGAYGGEIKNVLKSVRVIDKDLSIKEYSCDEMNMRYRDSRVHDEGLIVLEAVLQFEKGNQEDIDELYKELTFKRTSKQPLEYPSAGSTFKRPEGHFASKLIDDSGLRGYRYKDAQVSEKHCGFVINRGEADFEQIIHVIHHVQKEVFDKFNVKLEPEVRIIGEE